MLSPKTLKKLQEILKHYLALTDEATAAAVRKDFNAVKVINQKRKTLQQLAELYQKYQAVEQKIVETQQVADEEPALVEMVASDLKVLTKERLQLSEELETTLLGGTDDEHNKIIIEIHGAAGGDEANIFAGDLFRMYTKWAEKNNLAIMVIEANPSPAGGFAEIVFQVKGTNAWRVFKFEAGIHRVQRIPRTETKGRVHTSTATVAVLPEPTAVEIVIEPKDLRIDTYRSSGAGGQHVNKTDSAIRITHLPTKIVVTSQAGRSQHDNKDLAMEHLRSRLYQKKQESLAAERASLRRGAVGTGDRSEKIRTYNYPQNRITDHRIKQSWNQLQSILEGNLTEIFKALLVEERRQLLENE